MRYKCIAKYVMGDSTVMNPGDVIVMEDNKLYNITTGVDYCNISNIDTIKSCLESFTDDPLYDWNGNRISYRYWKPLTNVDKFKNITDEMNSTFVRKNRDYGDSFEESLNEEGIAAARIRMGDKWNRFKHLSKEGNQQVKDESIKDTLLDLANYAIMTVMWLEGKHSFGSDYDLDLEKFSCAHNT